MSAFTPNIDTTLRARILQRIWNEYTFSKEEMEAILTNPELGENKIRLLTAIIKSCSWYQLRTILTPSEQKDALSEAVLSRLWPETLQNRYRYAASVLFPTTLSASR